MKIFLRTAEPPSSTKMMVTFPPDFSSDLAGQTRQIDFTDGVAEVPGNVGRWMIKTERARATRQTIIEPETPSLIIPPRSIHV